MPIRIAVIAEAEADRRHICEMIDRKILHHAPNWWDEKQIEFERVYCGLSAGSVYTKWTELKHLKINQDALRNGPFIGFGHRHRGFDYPLSRKVLYSCVVVQPRVDAVVLIRDMDQQALEREASLAAAKAAVPESVLKVILALPRPKREAWILNGFEPRNQEERERFESTRGELSFDPSQRAEELYSQRKGAKRDAKRVLGLLTGGDKEREAACWLTTDWALLRKRGEKTGLEAFLRAVNEDLLPLITGRIASA